MATYAQGFPTADAPLTDANGNLSLVWYRFFISLFARTGGATGVTSNANSAPTVITPHNSPLTFNPSVAGSLIVSGGGVTAMTIHRGSQSVAAGKFYGAIPLATTDSVVISFMNPPKLTFFPS